MGEYRYGFERRLFFTKHCYFCKLCFALSVCFFFLTERSQLSTHRETIRLAIDQLSVSKRKKNETWADSDLVESSEYITDQTNGQWSARRITPPCLVRAGVLVHHVFRGKPGKYLILKFHVRPNQMI